MPCCASSFGPNCEGCKRKLGYTFVLATPDFAEAMAIADTIVLLREGRVVQIADPQTLV